MKATNVNLFSRGIGIRSLAIFAAMTLVLGCAFTSAHAGMLTTAPFTGDADCGVSDTKTYTHAYNVGENATNIEVNGVLFTGIGGTTPSASTGTAPGTSAFSTLGFGSEHDATSVVTGSISTVTSSFVYGVINETENPIQTLTLSDLEIGTQYITTFYNISWGLPGTRWLNLSASDDNYTNTFHVDENFTSAAGDNNTHYGNLFHYAYTAVDTSLTIVITPDSPGDSLHFYGFSNEVVEVPEPSTVVLLLGALVMLSAILRVKK